MYKMVSLFTLQCNIAIKWHRAQLRCIQFKYYHLNFNSFLLSIIYLCCKHLIPRFIIGIVWYFVDSGSIQILSHKNNNCLRKGLTKRTYEKDLRKGLVNFGFVMQWIYYFGWCICFFTIGLQNTMWYCPQYDIVFL